MDFGHRRVELDRLGEVSSRLIGLLPVQVGQPALVESRGALAGELNVLSQVRNGLVGIVQNARCQAAVVQGVGMLRFPNKHGRPILDGPLELVHIEVGHAAPEQRVDMSALEP